MQAVTKKKDGSSSRKAELQQQKSGLEEQVQGLDEQLETALIQLKVGCLHHAMYISSIVMQSNRVCVWAVSVFAVSNECGLQCFCSSQHVFAEWCSLHSKLRILAVGVTNYYSLHSG